MSLAEADEPLILADGTKIDPVKGTVIRDKHARGGFIEVPSNTKAQALIAKTRRSVAELPVPNKQMNVVSLVLFYSIWGLSDIDTATTLELTVDQIKTIKKTEVYENISHDLLKNVLEYEANDIRTFFEQNAKRAATKMVDLIEEDGALGFAATKEVLDRAGHRAVDIVEHRHKVEGGLRIEYVNKDVDEADIPTIETSYKDITPNGNRS